MNKTKVNYAVDAIALVSFLVTAVTGLAMFFFMPGGVRQGRVQQFLGIQKGTWTGVHDWAGIVVIVAVLIHVILHWNWIVCMTKSFLKSSECEVATEEDDSVKLG
jgi:cytochrome b subunit of formate dehydrogenase